MITLGASLSSEIASSIFGSSSFEGSVEGSQALRELLRASVLGRTSASLVAELAVIKGIPTSVEVLYVTHIR
jgi:hypothetical protein